MRGTSRRRAFVLPYVMMISVIVIAITGLVLAQTQVVESTTGAIDAKNQSFNAAEAGLNAALDSLDTSLLSLGGRSATLADGSSYAYSIHANLLSALGIQIIDPVTGQVNVNVPAFSAVVVSTGSAPGNRRSTTVEALVSVNVATINFARYAIVAGRNIQGADTGAIDDVTGANGASLHANGSINASIGGGLQGSSSASGNTNTLDSKAVHAAIVELPTISQFDAMVSNDENQTKLFPGPANLYVANGDLASSYTCSSTSSAGCLLFYDDKLNMSTQQVTFSGKWTLVVNGDLDQSGISSLAFVSQPGVVVVNGNASIKGGGVTNAYLEAKGNTALGGSGTFRGALITLGAFSFKSDASGTLDFDPAVLPAPQIIAGRVKVITYAEY